MLGLYSANAHLEIDAEGTRVHEGLRVRMPLSWAKGWRSMPNQSTRKTTLHQASLA